MYSQVSIINLDLEQLKSLSIALSEMGEEFLANFEKVNLINDKLEFISRRLSIRALNSQVIVLPKSFKLEKLAYSLSSEEEVKYELTIDTDAGLKVAYGKYNKTQCVFVFSNLHGEDIHVIEHQASM